MWSMSKSFILRAEVKWIDPDNYAGWDGLVAAEIAEPWDHFEYFTVGIGTEGQDGADNFSVCIATHAAVGRTSARGGFRGLVVDYFEPEEIRRKLNEYVSSITAPTWQQIVDQLRQVMHWEYGGYA
jgi:hypothetical protein